MNSFLKKFTLLFALVCFAPILLIADDSNVQFTSDRFGISFSYPNVYNRVDSEELQKLAGNVPILVVAKDGLTSTSFNMIVEIGEFDIQQSVLKIADKVIKDYRAIGITNVAASAPQKILTSAGKVFNTELFYTESSQEMYSNVSIIPAGEKHFILTFITNDVNQQKKVRDEVKKILDSVKLSIDSIPAGTKEVFSNEDNHKSAVPYVLCLIVIIFIAIFSSDKRNIGEDSSKAKD